MARTELPHGIILPAEYSDDWYDDMTSNLSKLDEVIGSDAEKLSDEDVGAAALSNDYTDLDNKPALKPVATSGDYDDLTNLPTYGITRFCSSAIADNSSVAFSAISSTNKIKVGDFLLDTAGKMYQISSVDTANETVSVTTPLTQLAVDSDVVHKSGNETIGGVKTFSDDTYIKSLNFTNEVPSPSSSSSSILPIITTITYGDSSPAVQARLNVRVTADGTKSFYPHENNQYSLGLTSRRWTDFFSYHGNFAGQQQGDEYSPNARTNLTLLANRDSAGQSGCVVDTFRENTTQGTGSHILGFGIKENSVRYEGCRFWWFYDDDNNGYVFALRPTRQGTNQPIKYELGNSTSKWDTINGLNPGSLSFPDLNNGIDISGYITPGNSNNTYTPLVDGYVSVNIGIASGGCAVFLSQGDLYNACYSVTGAPDVTGISARCMLPVKGGVQINIGLKGGNNYINSAKFYPCQGNV